MLSNVVALVAFALAIMHMSDMRDAYSHHLESMIETQQREIEQVREATELNEVWVRTHKHDPKQPEIE